MGAAQRVDAALRDGFCPTSALATFTLFWRKAEGLVCVQWSSRTCSRRRSRCLSTSHRRARSPTPQHFQLNLPLNAFARLCRQVGGQSAAELLAHGSIKDRRAPLGRMSTPPSQFAEWYVSCAPATTARASAFADRCWCGGRSASSTCFEQDSAVTAALYTGIVRRQCESISRLVYPVSFQRQRVVRDARPRFVASVAPDAVQAVADNTAIGVTTQPSSRSKQQLVD